MKTATLTRTKTGQTGTFGTLEAEGFPGPVVTGELPWLDNAAGKSCIPAGTYLVKWSPSGKYGMKYQLQDVPDRSHILIHVANWFGDEDEGLHSDVDGCIGLGRSHGIVSDERKGISQEGISGSGATVGAFEAFMGHQDFMLTIVDEYAEAGDLGDSPVA